MARTIPSAPLIYITVEYTSSDEEEFHDPPERPHGEPNGRLHGEPPGRPHGEPHGEPPGRPHEEPPGRPHEEPPGRPHEEPPGRPHEEPPGRPHEVPPGRPHGEPPGRQVWEPLNKLPEQEPFIDLTTVLSLDENLENVDPNIDTTENKVPQKKNSLSPSSSQETPQVNISKKKTKRHRKKSYRKVKPGERYDFPVFVISTKKTIIVRSSSKRKLPASSSLKRKSPVSSSSKRKLPASASENEREAKKRYNQELEKSNVLRKQETSLENNVSKYGEPSTSKQKSDESYMSCDDQSYPMSDKDIPDTIEIHSQKKKSGSLKSDRLSPEVTTHISTNEFSESDLNNCLSQNVAESNKFQYKVGYGDSNNLSADDEADDVQKSYLLNNEFVRRHKNSDHSSRESSDSAASTGEGTSVQHSKNDLIPFLSLRKRKKNLDREKSTEDPEYPFKLENLRDNLVSILPNTKLEKEHKKKLLIVKLSKEQSPDFDSEGNSVSKKAKKIEIETNEISSSDESDFHSSDFAESEELSDGTMQYDSDEENSEGDQCVPMSTPIKFSEEKSPGSNAERSSNNPMSRMVHRNENNSTNETSVIEQSPGDKALEKLSNKENSNEDHCVPESEAIKITNEKSSSPSRGRNFINAVSRMVHKIKKNLSNETSVIEQSPDDNALKNLSKKENFEEDQCVPENMPIQISKEKPSSPNGGRNSINATSRTVHKYEHNSSNKTTAIEQWLVNLSNETKSEENLNELKSEEEKYKERAIEGSDCYAASSTETSQTINLNRRDAILQALIKCNANYTWRVRVSSWVGEVYPDLVLDVPVLDNPEQDPVPDNPEPNPVQLEVDIMNMQPDEFYVDNIGNTFEVAAETCVAEEIVDEANDLLYCRKPHQCPSPSNPSADDEITNSDSENKDSHD